MAIPPLYSCNNWKQALQSIDQNTLHRAFSVLFIVIESSINSSFSERVLEIAEQIVSLLYTVIVRYPAYEKFIAINNLAPRYIASLLILFQHRMESSTITFFHSIVLLIISHLTTDLQSLIALNDSFASNFTTRYRPHRGTYADLIIEIITNPSVADFRNAAPLSPLAVGIIENLSSTTVHLSFFSANRIFSYLTKFFTTKIAEQSEYTATIGKLLNAVFQFVRFHLLGNQVIILYALERQKIINGLSQSNVEVWRKPAKMLRSILEAADLPIRIKNERERSTVLQNALSPILSDFTDPPVEQNAYSMSKDIEIVWYDWFRVMFWQLFPEDAEFYHLNFVSFQMPTSRVRTAGLNEMPVELSEVQTAQETANGPVLFKEYQETPKEEPKESEGSDLDFGDIIEQKPENEEKMDEETAVSIIKSMKPLEIRPKRRELIMNVNKSEKEELEKPTKKAKTLEELDNPFGSDDDDELAKFLED